MVRTYKKKSLQKGGSELRTEKLVLSSRTPHFHMETF